MARRRDFMRDQRGAVLAEFAIAIVPMLTAFFCFWQVAMLFTAKTLVRHSAIVGARAAAVIAGGADTNPTAGGRPQGDESEVKQAVVAALGAWGDNGTLSADAQVDDDGGPNGRVTVRVNATFRCKTPVGNRFVCGGETRSIVDDASLPKQGARYR